MLEGIDVSDVQGIIDWKKVKDSGVTFAFCKATDGTTFVAKRFKANWEGMKAAGLIRGAYHFCHTKNNPVTEATHFVQTVGELGSTDMLVLDIEDDKSLLTNEQFISWTLDFLEKVNELTNVTPIVYTGGPYFDKNGGKPKLDIIKELVRFPLWLAAYTKSPDKYVPYVWKSVGWTIWQRSGDVAATGDKILHVPGINCVVDRDQYKGTIEELTSLAISLHQAPIKIDPLPPLPIDLYSQKEVVVIDKPTDPPQPVLPNNIGFWDSLLQFFKKIFGAK